MRKTVLGMPRQEWILASFLLAVCGAPDSRHHSPALFSPTERGCLDSVSFPIPTLPVLAQAMQTFAACRTPSAPLRLRGGKRGRNSVVVGKQAHQKKQAAWTHFVGGETFGADAAAEPFVLQAPKQDKRPADTSSPAVSRANARFMRGSPDLSEPAMMQHLRRGTASGGQKKRGGEGVKCGGGAHRQKGRVPFVSAHTQVCDAMNRLGISLPYPHDLCFYCITIITVPS